MARVVIVGLCRVGSLILVLLFTAGPALAFRLPGKYVNNGGYIVERNGQVLDQHRANDLFSTASTIKLLTTLAALDTLGKDYRFTTGFLLDTRQVLYVRGGGDPLLTSEDLADIARRLRKGGLRRVSALVLDDSFFQLEHSAPEGSENSPNPYDAANGGLAINFNSIAINKHRHGAVSSGEPQTPTIPLMHEIGRQLRPGRQRVNINAFTVSGSLSPALRYTAEVLGALLRRQGIAVGSTVRHARVPANARLLFEYRSPKTLEQVVHRCLRYSNNFIANQLALTSGARRFGAPATWEKARRLLTDYALTTLHIPAASITIREGSGLSHRNRITPAAMVTVLEAFWPHRDLLPIKHGLHLKSGTLHSVFCYAGYLESHAGPVLFAVLLNQKRNTRNLVLRSIKHALRHSPTEVTPLLSRRALSLGQ